MTKEETKQFNIRIAQSLYDKIKGEADSKEITMTEYVTSKLTADSPDVDERYTSQLEAQIEQLEQSIQKQDEHIQQLARLIDQQQQLTLNTQRNNEQLKLELDKKKDNRQWWKIWK